MGKPTVRVRVAFADGPYVASPTWTDITTYVRGINTSRGRNDDWQNFDSGSASLVLDNRTRRFDPTYTAGPYYGNLQPRRQIYIDATTDGGSTYKAIFRGYIDGWPVFLTQSGYDSTVTINCYDQLGLLSQNTAPYDWADAYLRQFNPIRYIKGDDVVNSANPTASQLTDYGSFNTKLTVTAGSGGAVINNIDSLALGLPYRATNTAYGFYFSSANTSENLTGVTAGQWTTIYPIPNTSTFLGYGPNFSFYNYIGELCSAQMMYKWDSGLGYYVISVDVYIAGSPTELHTFKGRCNLDPTKPHHFAFTSSTMVHSPSMVVYVDGVQTAVSDFITYPPVSWTSYYRLELGFQQSFMFKGYTDPDYMKNIYNLSLGQIQETTADRFTRAMGQTSVDPSLYSTAANPVNTVAKINNGGEPIRTTIQLAGDSEAGEIYTSKAGVLTFVNQNWYTGTTAANSQATFGASGIPIGTDMNYNWTANGIRNALNMTWSGDTTINVKDDTSIAAYGAQQDNYDTQISTAAQTQSTATVLVGFGKLPRLVMSAVQLNQALSFAQWATVLDLELLQRITVAVPERVGSNVTQQQIIQQIEHQITPGDWQTTILGSSRWSSVFVLNSSVLDGVDLLG